MTSRVAIFSREVARRAAVPSLELTRPLAAVFAAGDERVEEVLPAVIASEHTPLDIAERAAAVSRPAALVVARVDGELWDMTRPLPAASASSSTGASEPLSIEFFGAASEEGQQTLWRTAARLLGGALETHVGEAVQLCDAVALEDATSGASFYADVHTSDGTRVTPEDFAALEKLVGAAVSAGHALERVDLPLSAAMEMFEGNAFRHDALEAVARREGADATVAAYRCGDFVDVCEGPHVPNVQLLQALSLQSCSGAHWRAAGVTAKGAKRGSATELQRVFGVAFPKRKQLRQWEGAMKEARARDHRVIGKQQQLFAFSEYSPGSALMLPHGTRIYNTLVAFLRTELRRQRYDEVRTPLLFDRRLWEISGHWDHYKENMYSVVGGTGDDDDDDDDGDEDGGARMSLKPMSCPAHCLIFDTSPRTHREMPVRLADFSALHRNEATGALHGLTRVRRFAQDDGHIFCADDEDQMRREVAGCLELVERVYGKLGFEYSMRCSTRPEKSLGDDAAWEKAEGALREALDETGRPWEMNPGDGAFYGPKIDVTVRDALGREHQCATVQLDFQLPSRFGLKYTDAEGESRTPVLIHRAILGSLERMLAILIEHTKGRWPLWLSPRQCAIVPISGDAHGDYAHAVRNQLDDAGLWCESFCFFVFVLYPYCGIIYEIYISQQHDRCMHFYIPGAKSLTAIRACRSVCATLS